MGYRSISGKQIVARMFINHNIDYNTWESYTPEWIAMCLADLKMYGELKNVSKTIEVYNYRFQLPCDIKLLNSIEYEGFRLPRLDENNTHSKTQMEAKYHLYSGYMLEKNKDRWVTTTFEEDEVIVHYKAFEVEYDEQTGIYWPYVPDVEQIKAAIESFILTKMLQKGYIHPVYNLRDGNPYTNPALKYDKVDRKKAMNSIILSDEDEREEVSKLMRTFLVNSAAYYNEHFNNNNDGY